MKEEDDKFEGLTIEQRKALVEPQLRLLGEAISAKTGTLQSFGGLFVALLIIATFDKQLINLPVVSEKILITLLLLASLASLWIYIVQQEMAAKKSQEIIQKYVGKDLVKEIKITWVEWLMGKFPNILLIVTVYVVTSILIGIWQS